MPGSMTEIITFIFGMCIGSFINVCIYRIPFSKSIAYPGSTCPSCSSSIRFYDNIPVLSYLLLGGRCRHCNASISFRYPLVEIMVGFLALCMLLNFGFTFEGFIYFVFVASLIVLTFIDIDHQLIPDVITLPGILIGIAASFALPAISFKNSIFGLLTGGGSLLAVAWTYHFITKKEGMGGGDIKLLAMIGSFLGWKGVLFTIFTASLAGAIVGVIIMLSTRKDMKLAVPFGPFLSFGAVLYIFLGERLIYWYLNPA